MVTANVIVVVVVVIVGNVVVVVVVVIVGNVVVGEIELHIKPKANNATPPTAKQYSAIGK